MNTLYVIAVGGSGERVLRSFTMALAAGVKIGANRVVPVIIDNDTESDALIKCKNVLAAYNSEKNFGVHRTYEKIAPVQPSFCQTEVTEPILLDVSGGNIGDLDTVIGCPVSKGLDDPNNDAIKSINAERELLFTDSERQMPLNVGFVGNPNIGSIVINSMSLVDEKFGQVENGNATDGVIVIGSLFGGTGAAGIPLIINKLLHRGDGVTKPLMGVVALLPYFNVDTNSNPNDNSEIRDKGFDVNSKLFDLKTWAALMYYDKNMSKKLDFMYYVGDDNKATYKKCIGGKKQQNPASMHELMAAMSIIDFTNEQPQPSTTYKRPIWGVTNDDDSVSNISGIYNEELKRAIVKFIMMEQVFKHEGIFPMAVSDQKKVWDFVKEIGFDEKKLTSVTTDSENFSLKEAKGLNNLIKEFDQWLNELSTKSENETKPGRKQLFFQGGTEADKLGQAFVAESEVDGMNLAKYKEIRNLFGKLKGYESIDCDILDALQDAYHKLDDKYHKSLSDDTIIPVVLLYISNALDKVLDEKFNL